MNEKIPTRKVLVFDPLTNLRNKQNGVKHPSSKHIISAYANEFNNRPYNYNDVGEFELYLGAGEYRFSSPSSPNAALKQNTSHHKILIWPEGIELELNAKDIPDIYPAISKDHRLTPANLSSYVTKDSFPSSSSNKIILMIHVTKSQYMERGELVIAWLQTAIEEYKLSRPEKNFKNIEYILTLELMQSAGYLTTQIMAMPGNLVLNDALSLAQIRKFVTKHWEELMNTETQGNEC